MKKLGIGFLLVLVSFQVMAVGHPHNIFSARKQLKAKYMAVTPAFKTADRSAWTILSQAKTGIETSCRLVKMLHKLVD